MDDLKNIIESLLFVAEAPISLERFKLITIAESKEIRETLKQLAFEYDQRRGGFYLREVAGGYQIRTRPEYTEWIKRLLQPSPTRFSRAAMETLAIIAYKQPIIRSEIEHIRGVDSGGVLRLLLERKLIRILGRKEIPGRPLIYATTKQFLEMFDLKDLKSLPTPKEIEAFGQSSAELDLIRADPADDDEPAESSSIELDLIQADTADDGEPAESSSAEADLRKTGTASSPNPDDRENT